MNDSACRKEPTYKIDDSKRDIRPFLAGDSKNYQIRFENADLNLVCDSLNKLSEDFTVVPCSVIGSLKTEKTEENVNEVTTVTGFFSGNYYEMIRDICASVGWKFDRIDDHFYIGANLVDVASVRTETVIETSLKAEELEKLKQTFGEDVQFHLINAKLLISGRFYAVKKFREYVERLNERRRSYVARIVFVRLERSQVVRLESELRASTLDLISSGYNLYDVFETQLDIKFNRERSYNFSEQEIYCSDGQKSSLKIGASFSRENRTVSDYGTSSVTGYQQFEDGVDVELTPHRSINGVVDLALKFGNSKFSDASTLSKNQIDLTYESLSLEENKLYYIATLNENSVSGANKFLGLSASNDSKNLTCWLVVSPVESCREFIHADAI